MKENPELAIISLKQQAREYNQRYRSSKHELERDASKQFRKKHKMMFRTFDIIGVVLILINFIAVFLTGILVEKQAPHTPLVEANQAQCKLNGYQCASPKVASIVPQILIQCLMWAFIVFLYVLARQTTYSWTRVWIIIFILVFYFLTLSVDTIHDIGVYVGILMYG